MHDSSPAPPPGTITLTTIACHPDGSTLGSPTTQTIVNAPGVPFISKVVLQQVAGGVTVVITGFSSTRDMTNAVFQFAPATGDTFTSNNVSVPVQNAFNTWWSNTTQSNPFGTQFTLTVPFTLATPTQSVSSVTVVSVTVTLQNSKGASQPGSDALTVMALSTQSLTCSEPPYRRRACGSGFAMLSVHPRQHVVYGPRSR